MLKWNMGTSVTFIELIDDDLRFVTNNMEKDFVYLHNGAFDFNDNGFTNVGS